MAMYVGQPKVATLELVRKAFMVDAQEVHHRRVKIVNMHAIGLDVVAVVVCYPVSVPRVHTATGHSNREATWMMIAAEIRFGHLALAIICPAKFTAPNNQRIVEHSARF